jgi:ADP-ribose pyrophosphatase
MVFLYVGNIIQGVIYMDMIEKTLSSEYIYKGRILNLRRDKVEIPGGNGKTSSREIIEHTGAVAIVAIDEKGRIILEKQFRKAAEEILIEIPAGLLEEEEEPESCAARELEEETGLIPGSLKHLTTIYSSPGFTTEKIYVYMATELKQGRLHPDEDERIDLIHVSLDEAVAMINKGDIKDAKTVVGILTSKQFL